MKPKMMIRMALVCLAVMTASQTFAQQNAGHTQYLWNQLSLNPAYAGSKKSLATGLSYRAQWLGIEGAPLTENFFVHSPLSHGQFGTGLNVMRDRLGITNNLNAQASFAYKMNFDFGTISVGMSGVVDHTTLQWTSVDPTDQVDPSIPYADVSQLDFNAGFGLHFQREEMFFGLSVPRLLENEVGYPVPETNVSALLQGRRHIHAIGGYMWQANRYIWVQPYFMTRYVAGAPFQLDLGCLVQFNKTVWVGGSFRWGDSVDFLLNYNLSKQLKLGYSFDFSVTKIQGHAGSHELFLGYELRKKKDGYNHPRFF
ncbi:PorP/SprF family type IX secretion system membrane protein [Sanyastnella coralliicola]|uniref:PorP/SprF family type IX secretion system membrane protein n=1 Tax=Sanyastnella coralliicola TaxID=3069118 RepID=UPI0027BAB417|nr:type IX secretion system membrane protein PorP/SprF [Longitalea sp. SCSIO 12813]